MIIVLGSKKGGVGKSTLAVALAGYLIQQGHRVLIVDADDQQSVLRWYNNRTSDMPHIPVTAVKGNIKAMLNEYDTLYDYVIADCAGRDSSEARSGLLVADVFISPLRPSQMDLDIVPDTCEVFTVAKEFNEKVRGYLVMNMTPTNLFTSEAAETAQALEDYPEMKLAQSRICDRKVHRDAWSESLTVFEKDNSKAHAEIKALVEEVIYGNQK